MSLQSEADADVDVCATIAQGTTGYIRVDIVKYVCKYWWRRRSPVFFFLQFASVLQEDLQDVSGLL